MPPRLVRRRTLNERIRTYFNPWDFLLWLSEELESNDWDQWHETWATPIGLTLNIVFLIARANSGPSLRNQEDDVFGDIEGSSGWLVWFATFVIHFLAAFSFMNAFYTFCRTRHYRLFENSIDAPPSTPSAHRVRVDSSPLSSSPMRFLSSMLAGENAESRSHPDATRDVWELAVWDPMPLSLRIFCLFSPGHILVYWLFLPTTPQDPRPSTTILTTLVLAALLSAQLIVLRLFFSQQSKDASIVHKEVLNEYDTKYVHPRTRPRVRDVGTQHPAIEMNGTKSHNLGRPNSAVDTYTPTVVINKGFHTRPNPNYARYVDPEGSKMSSPLNNISISKGQFLKTAASSRDGSSPLRSKPAVRQPNFIDRQNGDGGSLGIYSHAHSPLRKAASTNFTEFGRERERSVSPVKREAAIIKSGLPELPSGLRRAYRETSSRRQSGKF